MTDQSDREQESQATEETKFEREVDDDAERRRDAAERLQRDDAAESPDEDTAA